LKKYNTKRSTIIIIIMKEEEIERRFKVSVTAKTPPGVFQQAI